MGLFSMLQEDSSVGIPIPKLAELKKADLMLMEKETTGIYLSGHPMDDYRQYLKRTRVVRIAALMGEDSGYKDDQIVSIAGVIQSVKMKTTRNNSMMAYVTASIEMLAFSNVINQYGGYLRENEPVVITGRISLREDKDPQIVVNRARPMSDFASGDPVAEMEPAEITDATTLYLRLPSEEGVLFPKIRAIINMFPGKNKVVVYFEDTRQRRGALCALAPSMINELNAVLGKENVVMRNSTKVL